MNTKDSTTPFFRTIPRSLHSPRIGNGDSYEIRLNDDADLVVVICLALSVDASENQEDTASVIFILATLARKIDPLKRSSSLA
jgi:hypothetical protein